MTSYTHLSDEDLMLLFQKGDEQAFEELVNRYESRVFHCLYKMTNSYEDADELTWEVFYKVAHYKDKFTDTKPGGFAKWIFTIAINTGIDFIRARSKGRSRNQDELEEKGDE